MPTITAQSIVDRAEQALLDETNVRWAAAELLGYLNDGQRETVSKKPSAYTKNATILAVAGTKQTIPASGIQFSDAIRNMGTNGTTPGRVITPIRRRDLDMTRPDWHAETPNAETQHYMFDPRDPKTFYVTPPQPAVSPGYLEIIYSAAPPDVAIGDVISLDDIYQTPLYYYTMFRAHSKETEAGSPDKAAGYYKLFTTALSDKMAGEQMQ